MIGYSRLMQFSPTRYESGVTDEKQELTYNRLERQKDQQQKSP